MYSKTPNQTISTPPKKQSYGDIELTQNTNLFIIKENGSWEITSLEEDYENAKALNKTIYKILSSNIEGIKEEPIIGNGAIYFLTKKELEDFKTGQPNKKPKVIEENEKYYSIPTNYDSFIEKKKDLEFFVKNEVFNKTLNFLKYNSENNEKKVEVVRDGHPLFNEMKKGLLNNLKNNKLNEKKNTNTNTIKR